MKADTTQYFNGVQLTQPCDVCHGEGELQPPPGQESVCPGCEQQVKPIDTTEEDARRAGEVHGAASYWCVRNPLKCPACGACGDYSGWAIGPSWCVDCQGTGRKPTAAGRELLAFIDAWRKPAEYK